MKIYHYITIITKFIWLSHAAQENGNSSGRISIRWSRCYFTQNAWSNLEVKKEGTALDSNTLYNKVTETLWMLEYLLILDIDGLMEDTGRISLKPGRKTTTESSRQISRDSLEHCFKYSTSRNWVN
jgi:hypothetical protein